MVCKSLINFSLRHQLPSWRHLLYGFHLASWVLLGKNLIHDRHIQRTVKPRRRVELGFLKIYCELWRLIST